jgi:hypothetical protein
VEERHTRNGSKAKAYPCAAGQQQRYPKLGDPKTFPMALELLGANFDRYAKLYRELFGLK